jgi:hypothetical protein
VLLDELREHQTWDAWAAVTKTTRTREFAQIWAASNAGDSMSIVLSHLRTLAHIALGDPDGIVGEGVEASDDVSLGMFEWSAAPGCDVTDRDGWAQANPSMGHIRSMERSIASDVQTDPEGVFRTEVLCQWVVSLVEGAFPPGVWESTFDDAPITGKPVVGVETRTGVQQSAAIMVAGSAGDFDVVEVARYALGSDERWAHDFILQETLAVLERLGSDEVVVDKFGENAALIPLLEDAGITVRRLDTTEMRNATTAFRDAVINGRIRHRRIESNEPLNVAVLGAGRRKSGELSIWSQSASTTDITTLRAATAAWWVHTSTDRNDYDPLGSIF